MAKIKKKKKKRAKIQYIKNQPNSAIISTFGQAMISILLKSTRKPMFEMERILYLRKNEVTIPEIRGLKNLARS